MPIWLISKYFYREMNPVLRYALVPFLLFFNISVLLALLAAADIAGVWSMPVDRTTAFLGQFGTAGTAVWFLLAINIVVTGLIVLVAVPLYFIRRDVRKTIERFGVLETSLTVDAEGPYEPAAREVFEANPDAVVFCYGHTHRPLVRDIEGGVMVNTGTWLKRLHRRDGIIGVLPPVFYPSYQLAAVRIAEADEGILVEYETERKPSPATEELTRTERFFTVGREPEPDLPERVVIDPETGEATSLSTDIGPSAT